MGRTNEFTLVAGADFEGTVGTAVVVGATLVHKTPTAVVATAGKAIDGIITDITPGAQKVLAVAKVGDIVFAKLGDAVTVGDELEVGTAGVLAKKNSGEVVAKALATGVKDELIPVIIK